MTEKPLYPFGHGLSYSKFVYGDSKLSKNTISTNENVTITIPVTNVSERDGEEVVQVYIKRNNDAAPVKTLRAFERALIKSKETKNIQLTSPKIHLPSMMKKQMIWFRNPAIIPFFMAELLMMRG
jgi:beta-glucosidase